MTVKVDTISSRTDWMNYYKDVKSRALQNFYEHAHKCASEGNVSQTREMLDAAANYIQFDKKHLDQAFIEKLEKNHRNQEKRILQELRSIEKGKERKRTTIKPDLKGTQNMDHYQEVYKKMIKQTPSSLKDIALSPRSGCISNAAGTHLRHLIEGKNDSFFGDLELCLLNERVKDFEIKKQLSIESYEKIFDQWKKDPTFKLLMIQAQVQRSLKTLNSLLKGSPELVKTERLNECANQLHQEHKFFRIDILRKDPWKDYEKDLEACRRAEKIAGAISDYATETAVPELKKNGEFIGEKMVDIADEAWDSFKTSGPTTQKINWDHLLPKKSWTLRRIDSPGLKKQLKTPSSDQ